MPPDTQPLLERWDGSHWTIQSTPSLANGGEINGISCASQSACTATGQTNNSGLAPIAEDWDGNNWTIEPIPDPSRESNLLTGVSCASATACTAVGEFTGVSNQPTGPGVEVWDGSSWTVQAAQSGPALSVGVVTSMLTDVSCPSPGVCVAVGSTSSIVASTPLTEIYP